MSKTKWTAIVLLFIMLLTLHSYDRLFAEELATPLKFDFGCETSPTMEEYLPISNKLLYEAETGYGLDKEVSCRDRGAPDDLRRDFTNGKDYSFIVDLPNGGYFVKILSGDHIAANKTDITIEGEQQDRIEATTNQFAEEIYPIEVKDHQLNLTFDEDGRVNSLEIYSTKETSPPVWPENSELILSNITETSVDLSWTMPTDNVAVTQYRIYQNNTLIKVIDAEATEAEQNKISYHLSGSDLDLTNTELRIEAGDASDNWTENGPTAHTQRIPEEIKINGPNKIQVSNEEGKQISYQAEVLDQFGFELLEEGVTWELAGKIPNSIRLDQNGKLTIDSPPSSPLTMVLIAISKSNPDVKIEQEITIYRPVEERIIIIGPRGIALPEKGKNTFSYRSQVMDQFGAIIPNAEVNWSITSNSPKGVKMSRDGKLTVSSNAKEQSFMIQVTSTNDKKLFQKEKLHLTTKHYKYLPIDGGFTVENGEESYNRPLYGPHHSPRIIALVGDKPDSLLFQNRGNKDQEKLGHVFFGLKNGKWFADFESITSRYVYGHQEYELRDPSIDGTIRLSFVRPTDSEGLLIKVTLPDAYTDDLVVASGGRDYGSYGSQDYESMKFHPEDTEGTEVSIENNYFSIRGGGPTLYGTANIPLALQKGDASVFSQGPDALLEKEAEAQPMAIGTTEGNYDNHIYFNMTTDDIGSPEMDAYLTEPETVFAKSLDYYKQLSQSIKLDTPNPYLDAALPAASLALDASWSKPTFMHGPINWFVALPGWRSTYGVTAAGWEDRAFENAEAYFEKQASNGRIPSKLNGDSHYNMGEVLIDMMLYNWEWTGNLDIFKNGGFDFIAKHLSWMDEYMETEDEGLYESHLNAWNTDNKWNNGGGATIASVYTWRANKEMAAIAKQLGKDPTIFEQRTKQIEQAMKDKLWVDDIGVFGEYKDVYGLKRVHTSPDLSSIYTPIDLGFTDPFESYQMLQFSENRIENELGTTPRNGRLPWTSNWLPNVYSSRGIYTAETINLMLTYYRLGLTEQARDLQAGVDANLFAGPGPGVLSYIQNQDGSQSGHVDFTDVTSMYVRTAVEGLFGIKMDVPNQRATIQPAFPQDWEYASIDTDYLAYDYHKDGAKETMVIHSEKSLAYDIRLIAKDTKIKSVKINGSAVDYSLEPGIGHPWLTIETPEGKKAEVEITYQNPNKKHMPELKASAVGAIDEAYHFSVKKGKIVRLHDPQGILDRKQSSIKNSKASVVLKNKPGAHTFFVLVESGESEMWLPVNLNLKEPLEIVDGQLVIKNDEAFAQFAIENNSQENINLKGTAQIAGTDFPLHRMIKANTTSDLVTFKIENPSMLTPGENLLTIYGNNKQEIKTNIVNWELDDQLSGAYHNAYQSHPIDLSSLVNQDLANLHQNKYTPQPELFYWDNIPSTVTEYGLNWWQYRDGQDKVKPSLTKLDYEGDHFKSDMGIPFLITKGKENAVFTSLYDNFPDKVEIPVNMTGNKLYFFLTVATNHMQSRIENAKITVNLEDGTQEILPLTNPENIDDWLKENTSSAYAQSGFIQELGDGAHGNILSIDLGKAKDIESVELQTLSNEVLAGLLGLTVLEQK